MERTLWVDRKFTFDYPDGWYYNVLERLYGTVARIKDMTEGVPEGILEARPNDKWSIKEHIGHLADLEDLHTGRIADFLEGKDVLRAADMSNTQTKKAQHILKPLDALIKEFEEKRNRLLNHFEDMADDILIKKSLHPRLQVMMRPIDLALFCAEHDDHHLTTMRMIIKRPIQI